MSDLLSELTEILNQHEIVAESLDRSDIRDLQKRWLEAYVCDDAELIEESISRLRKQGLKPVTEKLGKGFIVGIEGASAEEAYLKLPPSEFIWWEPFDNTAFYCQTGRTMPMFGAMPCGFRSTITSLDLEWTATLPGLCCAGQAFFARKEWQASR